MIKRGFFFILVTLLMAACQSGLTSQIPDNTAQPSETPAATSASQPAPTTPPTLTPAPQITVSPIQTEQPIPNVTLNVELHYSDHWMKVQQIVELENTSTDTWEEVVFNIPLNWVEDAFYLDAAFVKAGYETSDDYPFFGDYETVLPIPLPRPVDPDDAVEIELLYRIVIPPVAPTDWPPVGTTGWTFELIQAGEWYPALVPYVDGEGWMTWRYHPVGDPTIYPLVDYLLNVTCEEENITVVSGGLAGQEGNTWHFEIEAGRGIAFLASDTYQMVEQEVDGVPIRSYYLAGHEAGGQAALDIAIESLILFNQLYGPYPYQDLTLVENGFFGGMEYSALASVTDYVYYTYPGEPPSILHALVAHEVAHQWWYGAVGNDQVREPWLDESLAFYSEFIYFEHYYPDLVDWWWVKRVDQYVPQGPVDVTIYEYEYSSDFILWMYGRAAHFMHDLRALMGDQDFFNFLQTYYTTYSGKLVTSEDFFTLLEEHTNEDFTPLLEEYFSQDFIEAMITPP